MAGHKGGRAGRVARWRENLHRRLERCSSDGDRLAIYLDSLRIALRHCVPPNKHRAVVDEIVAELAGRFEDLIADYERKAS